MSRNKSPEEVRDQYVRLMGPELGELYYELYSELSWLQVKWQQYRELFGISPERVDLLNSAAPIFFGVLQKTLFNDILLHLARLTDRPKISGRHNLTVHKVPELIVDPLLKHQIESGLKQVDEACTFARQLRNRRLAHSDLLTIRNPELLPGASRQSIEDVLAAIRELLNRLELHYCSAEMAYETPIYAGGADVLVYYIERGLESERDSRRTIISGRPD